MKKYNAFILTAALTATSFTVNAENKWYVGASLNAVDVDQIESSSTAPVAGVTRNLNVDSDSDVGIGIKIGRELLSTKAGSLAVEISYSQTENDVDGIQFQQAIFVDGAAEGEIEVESLLLRAAYTFNTGGAVKPYVGIGVGLVDLSVDARYGGSIGSPRGTQPPFATGSDDAFALEFRVGANYDLNTHWALFAEYSYTDVSDVNFSRLGGGPGGLTLTSQEADFDFQAFTVGVNYKF